MKIESNSVLPTVCLASYLFRNLILVFHSDSSKAAPVTAQQEVCSFRSGVARFHVRVSVEERTCQSFVVQQS